MNDNNVFGVHLTIDGYVENPEDLKDINKLYNFLDTFPEKVDMHKISKPQVMKYYEGVRPNEGGLSGFVIIAESHISVHTFPNKEFITINVYSCKTFERESCLKAIIDYWKIKKYEDIFSKRGTDFTHDTDSSMKALDEERKETVTKGD